MINVLITNPRGKERLVKAFRDTGAGIVNHIANADLVIPTVDEELPFFSNNTHFFDTYHRTVMVGSENTIYHCRDKAEFNLFCKRHGFQTPRTWHMNCYVKPRYGKGSRGIIKVNTSFIVQEECDFPEVSIDYFANYEGKCLSMIPRYRKGIINGESTEFELVKDFNFKEVERLGKELHLIGHNVIQGFWTGDTFIFSEVNPRFGGGSWLTFHIFNSPKWLVENHPLEKSNHFVDWEGQLK